MNYQKKQKNKFTLYTIIFLLIYLVFFIFGYYYLNLKEIKYFLYSPLLVVPIFIAFTFIEKRESFRKGIDGEDKVAKIIESLNIKYIRDLYIKKYKADIDFVCFIKGNLILLEVKNWEIAKGDKIYNELNLFNNRKKELEKIIGGTTTIYPRIITKIVFINNNSPLNMKTDDLLNFKDLEPFLIEKIKKDEKYNHELEEKILNHFGKIGKVESN